jgi:hypothetical protein
MTFFGSWYIQQHNSRHHSGVSKFYSISKFLHISLTMDLTSFHIYLRKQYSTTVKTFVWKTTCLGHQPCKWLQLKKNSYWKTVETGYISSSALKRTEIFLPEELHTCYRTELQLDDRILTGLNDYSPNQHQNMRWKLMSLNVPNFRLSYFCNRPHKQGRSLPMGQPGQSERLAESILTQTCPCNIPMHKCMFNIHQKFIFF